MNGVILLHKHGCFEHILCSGSSTPLFVALLTKSTFGKSSSGSDIFAYLTFVYLKYPGEGPPAHHHPHSPKTCGLLHHFDCQGHAFNVIWACKAWFT